MLTVMARAHVNWGRWIASCPNVNCNSAEEIHPWTGYECGHRACRENGFARTGPDTMFCCSECRTLATVEWPRNAEAIWDALNSRPNKEKRNWYPQDHELALRFGLPHGQTIVELAEEFGDRV